MSQEKLLQGQVTLVTGASRGIGKGIAQALGEAGAIVYLTGRSLTQKDSTVPLSGTLQETAEQINHAGGQAIAIHCDHTEPNNVKNAVEHINKQHGKLNILVNNAWAGYQPLQRGEKGFATKFWKHTNPETFWDSMFDVGVRSHYIASSHAARIMVKQQSGLIINLSSEAGFKYRSSVAYGVSKATINRMSEDMAHELRSHNVAVIALCPGRTKTEMVLTRKGATTHNESPIFVGRSVVALASDPKVIEKTGSVLITRELALEYGFIDLDGTQPSMKKGF